MGRMPRARVEDSNFSRANLSGLDMHGVKDHGNNIWAGASRALAKGDDPDLLKSEEWFDRHQHLSRL
jgi:hypothetical protein